MTCPGLRPGARPPFILPPPHGGAGAPVIDPARPGANPPHAPRGHPGTNEGMNAASGLPAGVAQPAVGTHTTAYT
jgi:hypothetical protein